MKDYVFIEHTNKDYDGFVLCLTTESLFEYMDNIKSEALVNNSKGTLLIDQLLITGDQYNRYVTFDYDCGELILNSAKNVVPDDYYRKLAIDLLKENADALEYTLLTSYQKQCINAGVDFQQN